MRTRPFSSSRVLVGAALAALGLLFLPVLGCSTGDEIESKQAGQTRSTDVDGEPSAAVLPYWDALVAESGAEPAVRWSVHGTPKSLFGSLTAPGKIVSAEDATRFLVDHAGLFGMDLGLADVEPSEELESPMGSHYTFAQEVGGVPVHGAMVKVHVSRDGRIVAVVNDYVPDLHVDSVEPAFSEERAIEIALADVAVEEQGATEAELVIDAGHGAPALAWRVTVPTLGPTYEVFVDARTGDLLGEPVDLNRYSVNGTGQIFRVNAVVATQNNALVDSADAASAVPPSAYSTVTLQGLAGTGKLDGDFASSSGSRSRVSSASNSFIYDRSSSGFNETMSYYYIDRAERYIQSLGFLNINNRQQVFSVDRYKSDNSYYTPSTKIITYGTGGVDDSEDGEVILHEYGHSIQDNQVPGFGSSAEGGAMGEGFGDYWAGTVGAQESNGFQDLCVAEWDAVSYASGVPHCLRRLDSSKHYPQDWANEVHADGEMWSASLWQIRAALGATKADKLILQAHFLLSSSANFSDGSNALVTAAVNLGYTSTEVNTIRTILLGRGFTVTA